MPDPLKLRAGDAQVAQGIRGGFGTLRARCVGQDCPTSCWPGAVNVLNCPMSLYVYAVVLPW